MEINLTNKKILVTGGAGFIGSNLCEELLQRNNEVVCLDNFATGKRENITPFLENKNFTFIEGDIRNLDDCLLATKGVDFVLHQAALGSVPRSIKDPITSNDVNVGGFLSMLVACRNNAVKRFVFVSTDEVYGTLGAEGLFTETTSYDPNSPYSASKASSDHFVRAYAETYGMPVVISNCSNNYGANQFPEKLIPLFINNIINNKALPVYGDGKYTRDWLYVNDHAIAIDLIFHKGVHGETYNIGGFNEWQNIDLIKLLCKQMDIKLGRKEGTSLNLISYVKDRPGHDLRYAIDASKINKELGWKPSVTFEEGLQKTIDWYLNNKEWMERIISGDYEKYYQKQYNS
ncbi:UNVERIFIED_CONTAM: hypothetical protein GTU68_032634 [Idotea baltica]|nr:hypothetical protein [Idotea baltica]